MTAFDQLLSNLTSPSVLAFFLGLGAALIRSDLRVPPQVHEVISQYLLFAIGIKGGFALSVTSPSVILWPMVVTVGMGCLTTVIAFAAARHIGKQRFVNSAALAAHYGSVSAVTFMACLSFIQITGGIPETYLTALLAVLEIPAIFIGLMLASRVQKDQPMPFRQIAAETFTGKTMLLLLGGIFIGMVSGEGGKLLVEPVFITLFQGVLVFFLLEMGIVAAERIRSIRKRDTVFICSYGIILPLLFGLIGTFAGIIADMSPSGIHVMATMAASASYIAAPAAVRLSIPQANAAIYLTASLGVTLPFNLIIGIPLYQQYVAFFVPLFN